MKNYIELQPKEYRDLYNIYSSYRSSGKDSSAAVDAMAAYIMDKYSFDSSAAKKLATYFCSTSICLNDPSFNCSASKEDVCLTKADIAYLRSTLLHESSQDLRRLLVSLVIFAHENPHKSNWIRYDRPTILYLAGLTKKKVSEQRYLTNQLHNLYNIKMQVVGSTQPLACFYAAWETPAFLAAPPAPGASFPEEYLPVYIGSFTPETVAELAASLPYEPAPAPAAASDIQDDNTLPEEEK